MQLIRILIDVNHRMGVPVEKTEQHRNHYNKETIAGSELWIDGLLCAFEYVKGQTKPIMSKSNTKNQSKSTHPANYHNMKMQDGYVSEPSITHSNSALKLDGSHWVPIGWGRISELVQTVQINDDWTSQQFNFSDDEDERTIADLAAPYWERPAGPVWWCHVSADHPHINEWLSNAAWLHPAISIALRDESRLISERMKHLLYEVH